MRGRIEISIQVAALIFATIAPGLAAAQGAQTVSLSDQLSAQYTMVKMGADSSGPAVVEQGTVLVVQKGGILGVPYANVSMIPATKYQDGKIQTPNTLVTKGIGHAWSRLTGATGSVGSAASSAAGAQTTHLFQVGEKVYPSRIEVNQAADKVTMGIVACDSCNNTNPTTFFKADVVFQFTKGYLSAASPPQVMDVIAQVFTIDDSGGGDQGGGDQGGQAQGGPQGGPPGGPPPPPAQPQTIQLGQTTDQVVAAIGQPDKIVNLGAKQIYVYKDIKVTFLKGKVSDVQ
jgi:hypothetical protein